MPPVTHDNPVHPSVVHALDVDRRKIGPLHARDRAARLREWPSWVYRYGVQCTTGDDPLSRFLSVCPDGSAMLTIVPIDDERSRVAVLSAQEVRPHLIDLLNRVLAAVPEEFLHYQWAIRPSPYQGWHIHGQIDVRACRFLALDLPGLDVDVRNVDNAKRVAGYVKKSGARKARRMTPAHVDKLDALAEIGLQWRDAFDRLGLPRPRMSGWVGIPTHREWQQQAKDAAVAAEAERVRQEERDRAIQEGIERADRAQRIATLLADLAAKRGTTLAPFLAAALQGVIHPPVPDVQSAPGGGAPPA